MTVIGQVAEAGEVFSSSAIRAELAQGDVKGAAQMLGWWWRVAGVVRSGAKRGTGLGFPTANIGLAPGTALAHGIYAVRVYADGEPHGGAAYLGTRPTFDDGSPVLEVFLFDFDGDLYGREIEVDSSTSFVPTAASTAPTRYRRRWSAIAIRPATLLARAPPEPAAS